VLRALVLAAAVAAALSSAAGPAPPDCRTVAGGPFLYFQANLVIPESRVECSAPTNRIRVWVELSMDGTVVATDRRDCRKTAVCHLDVGVATDDPPGDQQWCVVVRGETNAGALTASRSCESEAF
jgi:hypothetical protein